MRDVTVLRYKLKVFSRQLYCQLLDYTKRGLLVNVYLTISLVAVCQPDLCTL